MIAVCSMLIAGTALVVSVAAGRSARRHNQYSVRPLLQLWSVRWPDHAGIRLVNFGLGPAIITKTTLVIDGSTIGGWDEVSAGPSSRDGRGTLFPEAVITSQMKLIALKDGRVIPVGYDHNIYEVPNYDSFKDELGLWHLIYR